MRRRIPLLNGQRNFQRDALVQKFQIDAGTWATLDRLLDEALEQPTSQHEQWLANLAPDLHALRPRLRELLSRAGQIETGEFLHTLPRIELEPGEPATTPQPSEQPGAEIGAYRLVRELGSGGMGVVWLAERTDGLINRPVALKLPHGAWKRAGLAERMAREREILASLAHPNIAHLYDAGVTADGQPYLAIEYVEGVPIDVYCDERQLDVRARLRLFAQVVNAIAYAHGKLVVHRDLKPANILVSAAGQVRLLDFGIAKLLDEGQARETRLTELSGRALTPDYASPEQILGEPVTVATDVYSLGVVLYEVLSGQRPYKLQRDSRGALEDAILQAEPVPPSEVAESPWRKVLRGDLDTVVLKALKKQPTERYSTAHALLDDIERFLAAWPVLAQPDSRWYRARKFVARNKLGVTAVGAILTAVLIGAGVAVWQARVALEEKARAEEVEEFISAVFREADPTRGKGKSLSASELLLQAERRLHDRSDASPALQLKMLAVIGESLFGLQDLKESARIFEKGLQIQATATPDAELTARLHLGLSQAYEYLGRDDDALAQLRLAFVMLEDAGLTSTAMFVRAKLHEAAMGLVTNDYGRTERAGNEALAAASTIIGPRSVEVATALQLISKSYLFTHRETLAVERSKQALDLMLASYNGDYAHPRVIESVEYYANALTHVGDFDASAALMQDVTPRAIGVLGAQSRMVGELMALGVPAELERGNLRVAIDKAKASVAIYLRDSDPGSDVHAYRLRLLGNSLLAARAGTEAVRSLEEAVRVSAAVASTDPQPYARGSFGLALAHMGRFPEAQAEIDQALAGYPPGSRAKHQAMRNQGTLLRLQGRITESIPWFEKAIATARLAPMDPFDRGDVANGLLETGLARLELGEVAAAQQSFATAEALFSDLQKQHLSPARADLIVGMARVQMLRRDFAAALPSLQKADLFWQDFDPDNRWAGETALWLGRCYLALGRDADARAALDRAAKLLAASPLPADAQLVKLARVVR
jgi:serine/threonine-protein kinase